MDIVSFIVGVVVGAVGGLLIVGGFIYWKLKKLGVLPMIRGLKAVHNVLKEEK